MTRPLDSTGLKRLHRDWRRRTDGTVALLLDGVASPYNIGSIIRTAAAERVEHLWFTASATAPTATGVRKTALGTEKYLTWDIGGTGPECVAAAQEAGYRVVALELTDDAAPLHELDLGSQPVCLAIGHEDRGLAPATLTACDAVGFVPQLGRVGSLNVAVAAAVALYEVRRQEWKPG
ncbi:MAG: TrmH family RNA methyltransferase [Acidimicrobiia bacterium]|nr:TrmH family RNA methyltransferase [Acidimicrobiia bacterium]